ncbi:MAG: copper chaperone PCu(A)C [Gammaproteobacteria bacterium]|nr:copper chaperone PCu(A)C [Gammaproteobacteria bacterium]
MNWIKARLIALFVACLVSAGAGAQVASDSITVTDAYVPATPPGAPNGVAFMTLRNHSGTDSILVAANSSVSKVAELHGHESHQGMMRMRRVAQVVVPAGGMVKLESGGLHMMLIGLQQDLRPHNRVAIGLVFSDGSELHIEAPVHGLR